MQLNKPLDLSGKTALVTGCPEVLESNGKGIGRSRRTSLKAWKGEPLKR